MDVYVHTTFARERGAHALRYRRAKTMTHAMAPAKLRVTVFFSLGR